VAVGGLGGLGGLGVGTASTMSSGPYQPGTTIYLSGSERLTSAGVSCSCVVTFDGDQNMVSWSVDLVSSSRSQIGIQDWPDRLHAPGVEGLDLGLGKPRPRSVRRLPVGGLFVSAALSLIANAALT
jgi:hypothetical protein